MATLVVRRVNGRNCSERTLRLEASVCDNLASPTVPIRNDKLSTVTLQRLADLDEFGNVLRGVRRPTEPLLELLLVLVCGRRELVYWPGLVILEEIGHNYLSLEFLGEDVCALLCLGPVPVSANSHQRLVFVIRSS
jgi:hypothetical protein